MRHLSPPNPMAESARHQSRSRLLKHISLLGNTAASGLGSNCCVLGPTAFSGVSHAFCRNLPNDLTHVQSTPINRPLNVIIIENCLFCATHDVDLWDQHVLQSTLSTCSSQTHVYIESYISIHQYIYIYNTYIIYVYIYTMRCYTSIFRDIP